MEKNDLVYIDEYGLLGTNFYWHRFAHHGLSKEDILSAGLTSDRVQVSREIIDELVAVDREIRKRGWRLYIKEGYRSKPLYEIVYQRRVEKYGKEVTEKLFNMKNMPHAEGKSVDVAIWDEGKNEEIPMRSREDGDAALFIGFYKNKTDATSKRYQELQDYLAYLMMSKGFRIGTKREYFHFDYKPDIPENY